MSQTPANNLQLDHFLSQQLQNRDIPLGEILKEKGFVTVNQLEIALEKCQAENKVLGIALLELGFINQPQLKIALEDQAAIKKIKIKRNAPKRRLGDILLSAGACTEEQMAAALEYSASHGIRIGEAVVQLGIVTEDELAQSVGEQLMIPYIKLAKTPPDTLVLDKVNAKMALKHQVIPVKIDGNSIFLAMVDPQNILVIDDVEKSTGLKVVPMIVSSKDFKASYDAHYGDAAMAGNLIEQIDDADDKPLDEMSDADFGEDSAPIKSLMNKIVTQAVELGTSDIHVEPFENFLTVRYRIDGMMRKGAGPFPPKSQAPISSRVKVMAGLDISEVRHPQDGKFRMSLKGKIVDVRVSTCPTVWGEKIVMRILDQSGGRLRLNDLGIDKENLDTFTEGIHAPNGIVLVTGPTGSGKTTTLYSGLVALNKPSVNIQTAEDPVEYDLPGISQTQCLPEVGLNFSRVLKAFLRQDPNIILIGEIRDTETAQIALKAALTGHLVMSTLHTNSSVESIGRMLNMGIDRFLIAAAVRAILAQRLMRKLCEKCKEPYKPSKLELREIGITKRQFSFEKTRELNIDDITLYKHVGCKECGGAGYKGRMGVHEVMKMTSAMAEGVIRELSMLELKKIARDGGMMTLRDCVLTRALLGRSTIMECDRLTINEEKAAATAGDDDLIDEILIRSGSWKLTPKDMLARKKAGRYIPGDVGKLGTFFITEDVHAVEKELAAMGGDDPSASVVTGMVGASPKIFQELLDEIHGLEHRLNGGAGSEQLMQETVAGLKSAANEEPDKIKPRLKRLVGRLENSLYLMKLNAETPAPAKKKIPFLQGLAKDFYPHIPQIATNLSIKLGKKVDLNKIKFARELAEDKALANVDWNLMKIAFSLILENHMEALIDTGGAIKFKSSILTKENKIEILFHDLNPKLEKSFGNEVIAAGMSAHKNRLGLGLCIAKKILDAHGAEFSIQGIEKKGCRSRILIPLEKT